MQEENEEGVVGGARGTGSRGRGDDRGSSILLHLVPRPFL